MTKQNIEIIKNEDIQVYGISTELTISQEKNYTIIRNQWQKFNQELFKRETQS